VVAALACGLAFACGDTDEPAPEDAGTTPDAAVDSATVDGSTEAATDDAGSDGTASDSSVDATATCLGQAGTLDTTFGDGGVVTVPSAGSAAQALAIQSDGKLLFGGYVKKAFALGRMSASGRLDTSFADGGIVETAVAARSLGVATIALQPDGKILVAGSAGLGPNLDFVVARYGVTGGLDASFGSTGVARASFGTDAAPSSIAVLPGGKILVSGKCGSPEDAIGTDYALARFDSTGTLDPSFGVGGTVRVDVRASVDGPGRMIVQADGKILVAGGSSREPARLVSDASLVRFTPDGSLDPTFGTNGKLVTQFSTLDQSAGAIGFDGSGRIVVAGTAMLAPSGYDFALFRLSPSGALDESIGNAGLITTDVGGDEGAVSLFVRADGKLLVGGTSISPGGAASSIAAVRYLPDFTPDPGFGVTGRKVQAVNGFTFVNANAAAASACSLWMAGGWQPIQPGATTTWVGGVQLSL
jgi:uncharacterized delta-60 repeat protein